MQSRLKSWEIHYRHKEVECSVCIGDDYEKRTQLVTELVEVQLIVGGDLQDLIYCKSASLVEQEIRIDFAVLPAANL